MWVARGVQRGSLRVLGLVAWCAVFAACGSDGDGAEPSGSGAEGGAVGSAGSNAEGGSRTEAGGSAGEHTADGSGGDAAAPNDGSAGAAAGAGDSAVGGASASGAGSGGQGGAAGEGSGGQGAAAGDGAGGAPDLCGNGNEDEGEECDDENAVTSDACVACKDAFCGDGARWDGHEDCDDGDAVEANGCANDCTFSPAVCPDGYVQQGEACDDGDFDNSDGCTEKCQLPECGDGYVQVALGEQCDDGDEQNGDGCNIDCRASGSSVGSTTYAGADGGDKAYGVTVDEAGNVIVVGSTFVTGKGDEMFLWKLDEDLGELVFRTIPGEGDHPDVARDVAAGPEGRLFVVGDYYSEAAPAPGSKIWYGAFNSAGGEIWSGKTTDNATSASLVVDDDQTIFVVGTIWGQTTFNDVLSFELVRAEDDTWSAGWTNRIGKVYAVGPQQNGTASEAGQDIALTNNQNLVYLLSYDQYLNGNTWTNIYQLNAATGSIVDNPSSCCQGFRINEGGYVGQGTSTLGNALTVSAAGRTYVGVNYGTGNTFLYSWPEFLVNSDPSNHAEIKDAFASADWFSVRGIASGGTASNPVMAGSISSSRQGRVAKRAAPGAGELWTTTIDAVHIEDVAIGPDDSIYAVGWTDVAGQPSDVWVGKLRP
jgi:cysteine-rich repeat protein